MTPQKNGHLVVMEKFTTVMILQIQNHQTIISTNTSNGFQVSGVPANVDYSINKRVLYRVEGKMYDSKDPIFKNNKNNYSLTTNVTIKF